MLPWITELLTVQTAGIIGTLLAIGVALRKVWPVIQKATHFLDDVGGEPARPGVPARPGIMERISNIEEQVNLVEAKVDIIHHETRPNGGGSMNDAVRRLEAKVTDHIEITTARRQREDDTSDIVREDIAPVAKAIGEKYLD